MMIRSIVIEDNDSVREHTVTLINQYCPHVTIVGEADGVSSAVAAIVKLRPDLLFLDINLMEGSAFDIIKQIPDLTANIIFITAHNDFAIQAFRLSAIDYLLKPLQAEELIEAVKKAEEKLDANSLLLKIKALLKNVSSQSATETMIVLKDRNKAHIVKISEIIRCESDNTYTAFYMINGRKVLTTMQLKECDSLLSNKGFFRTHKSHIINLSQLSHVIKSELPIIIMTDESTVPLSLRKKDEFFNLVGVV